MKTIRTRRTVTQPVPDDPKASFTLVVGATGEIAECASIVPLIDIAARALADGHSAILYPPDTVELRDERLTVTSHVAVPGLLEKLAAHPDVKSVRPTGMARGT